MLFSFDVLLSVFYNTVYLYTSGVTRDLDFNGLLMTGCSIHAVVKSKMVMVFGEIVTKGTLDYDE